MIFADRLDAGRRLAAALAGYRGHKPIVLAIPRGAVPMAAIVADALDGDLDVVLVHKLCSRWNPEYAIGAIDETGWSFVSDASEDDEAWLKDEKAHRLAELRRRRALYSSQQSMVDLKGRVVIIVDDGLATGATMRAALHSVRAQAPARLICAVPVAAPASLSEIRAMPTRRFACLRRRAFRPSGSSIAASSRLRTTRSWTACVATGIARVFRP